MILLRIVTQTEKQAIDIARILLQEKLILNPNLRYTMKRLDLDGNEIAERPIFLLSAKSRSILFTQIEKRIRETFPDDMPEVYSLAVIHMDWEHATELSREIDF